VPVPSWSDLQSLFLLVFLPGAVPAFGITFLVPRRVLAALAILVGMAICNVLKDILDWWPGSLGWEALLPTMAVVMLLANLTLVSKTRPQTWRLARAALAGLAAGLLLVESQHSWAVHAWIALAAFALQYVLDSTHGRAPHWMIAACLTITNLAAALVLLNAYAAKLADLALIQASAWIGLALTACFRRLDLRIAYLAVALMLPCIMLKGMSYSVDQEVPAYSFILLMATPLLSAIALLADRWRQHAKLQYVFMVLLWVVYLAFAVILSLPSEQAVD
jgi:hypothetical protein